MTARWLRAPALAAIALLLAVAAGRADESLPLPVGGDFTLTDQHGVRRDSGEFRGRPVLLYFGYTSCPHSCGMALNTISAVLDGLGPRASELAALFVTVDPEHDTPARLAAFLANFHPAIVGLTGSDGEIERVRAGFRVDARRIADPGRFERLYEHGTFIYVLDADGKLRSILPPVLPPERIAGIVAGDR